MQEIEDNWERYYQQDISRLRNVAEDFKILINRLRDTAPQLLDQPSGLRFLLGGFVPNNCTPDDFINFCAGLNNNPKNMHIYLDMNELPFAKAIPGFGVQAKLEEMPFADESLDIVLLDGTLELMSDSVVNNFAQRVSKSLRRNGIILIAKSPERVREWAEGLYPVKTYFRSISGLDDLMLPWLKPIAYKEGIRPFGTRRSPIFRSEVFAYSRDDSDFERVELPERF